MLAWNKIGGSKEVLPVQHKSLHLHAPEKASLAQALLQIILDQACFEEFSSDGGGVAVMRLERWQIDLLSDFGILSEENPCDSSEMRQETCTSTPRIRRGHLSKINKQRNSGGKPLNDDWFAAKADENVLTDCQRSDLDTAASSRPFMGLFESPSADYDDSIEGDILDPYAANPTSLMLPRTYKTAISWSSSRGLTVSEHIEMRRPRCAACGTGGELDGDGQKIVVYSDVTLLPERGPGR